MGVSRLGSKKETHSKFLLWFSVGGRVSWWWVGRGRRSGRKQTRMRGESDPPHWVIAANDMTRRKVAPLYDATTFPPIRSNTDILAGESVIHISSYTTNCSFAWLSSANCSPVCGKQTSFDPDEQVLYSTATHFRHSLLGPLDLIWIDHHSS